MANGQDDLVALSENKHGHTTRHTPGKGDGTHGPRARARTAGGAATARTGHPPRAPLYAAVSPAGLRAHRPGPGRVSGYPRRGSCHGEPATTEEGRSATTRPQGGGRWARLTALCHIVALAHSLAAPQLGAKHHLLSGAIAKATRARLRPLPGPEQPRRFHSGRDPEILEGS